jgi:hypothetical protein
MNIMMCVLLITIKVLLLDVAGIALEQRSEMPAQRELQRSNAYHSRNAKSTFLLVAVWSGL